MGDDGGGDAACENPPKLYAQTAAGVYCPFLPADGGATNCAAGQHCCEGTSSTSPPSTCEPAGTPCPTGSIDWECTEAIDCTAFEGGGPVCCITATTTTVSSCGKSWTEWSGFTGTKCMASCPSPSYVECQQASDCTTDAGTNCTPSKANGSDFGYCSP